MADDLTLYALAGDVLDGIVSYYAAQGVELPGRRYVSDGLTAWDCDQLTVEVRRTFPIAGDVTAEVQHTFPHVLGRGVEVAIQLLRCSPTIEEITEGDVAPPDVAAIEESALRKLSDAEMIPAALLDAYRNNALPGCGGVAFQSWTSVGPEGGLTGGEVIMRLALE